MVLLHFLSLFFININKNIIDIFGYYIYCLKQLVIGRILMDENKKWDLIALASIPLIMTLGNSMLIPVLPTIEKRLEISSFQVSLLITIYSIAAIVLIPIAGFLSDEFGRKRVIIPSLIIVAIGGLISGIGAWFFQNSYWIIMFGRLIQGAGVSGTAPIVLPLVGDMFKSESDVSKGLGIIETANTFGKVLSPIVGSAFAAIIWFLPFLAIPVFSLISIILVLFLVKTPNKKEKPNNLKDFLKKTKLIFKQNGRWLYAIFFVGAIIMFVLFAVLFYLSETLEERHNIHGIKKGIYLAIPLGILSLSSYIAGRKIGQNKLLMKWVIFFGILLLSTSMFANSFFDNAFIHLLLLIIGGVGIGISLPTLDALITEGIEKEERGTITSIYSSMRFIGVAAGPPVAVALLKNSVEIMYITMGLLALLAVVIIFFAIKPQDKSNKKGTANN